MRPTPLAPLALAAAMTVLAGCAASSRDLGPRARALAEHAERASPREPAGVLRERAEAARVREDWARAGALYREVVERDPEDASAWYQVGVAALHERRPEEAIPALERSLALRDRASARYSLGIALEATGHLEEALPHFQRMVELSPGNGTGWKTLARAQLQAGQVEEAAGAVRRAQALLPGDAEVEELAGLVARRLLLQQRRGQ